MIPTLTGTRTATQLRIDRALAGLSREPITSPECPLCHRARDEDEPLCGGRVCVSSSVRWVVRSR